VTQAAYIPRRGDAVWITLFPQAGHEQSGQRPAVVLSPEAYNAKVGLALFCPVTSQAKGYPWEVRIPDGLAISGVVLADQVRSLDWRSRSAVKICKLPEPAVLEILDKLEILLRISD
jgi:mRNA interferase MazF